MNTGNLLIIMKISVITACYNSAKTIRRTLKSVNYQSHSNVEHIIVDGYSDDSTLDIIRKYGKRVRKVISEPDSGIYDAMNKGIAAATGDVIGFLHSDDCYQHEDVLKKYKGVFEDNEIDACYSDLVYTSRDDNSRVIRFWKSRAYEPGLCRKGWVPAHPTFYARSHVYEKYGKYDTSFPIEADFEMLFRLLEVHRINTCYMPEVTVRMSLGGESSVNLKNYIKGNWEALRSCHKHGYPAGLLFVIRKLMLKVPQFINRP